MTRADEVRRSLDGPTHTAAPARSAVSDESERPAVVAAAIEDWLDAHPELVTRVDFTALDGTLVTGSGDRLSIQWRRGSPVEVEPLSGASAGAGPGLPWWSMTKAATAVWLMRSVEQGEVSLSDPLSRWVPDVPGAERMTLEQLARHTAGLPPDADAGMFAASPAEAVQAYREGPGLEYEPGDGFGYTRLGYYLLALALERATGTTWRDAMEELADAAGVTLGFDEDLSARPRATDPDGNGYRGDLWASGGIVSSSEDAAGFLTWAMSEGVSASSHDLMTQFSAEPEHWFYGVGLMPLCPCSRDGDHVRASRYGLDALTGFMVYDEIHHGRRHGGAGQLVRSGGPGPRILRVAGCAPRLAHLIRSRFKLGVGAGSRATIVARSATWSRGAARSARRPVKPEVAGSNPVGTATVG